MDIGDNVSTGYAELNTKTMSDSLTFGIMQCKKQTLYRTYIELQFLQRNGYIGYNDFCNMADLGVSRRSIQSHIQIMSDLGWVTYVPKADRIYVRNQDAVARKCHVQYITTRGTKITRDDLKTKKKFQRWLISVIHSGGNGNPISRKVIQEKANICAKTQRKYEKDAPVKITQNFAVLGNFSNDKEGDKSLHYNHRAVFKTVINNHFQVLRQIPNSYISNVIKGIHKRKDQVRNEIDKTPVIWRYLERRERVEDKSKKSKVADEYYRKTRMRYGRGGLWFAEHVDFEYVNNSKDTTVSDVLVAMGV